MLWANLHFFTQCNIYVCLFLNAVAELGGLEKEKTIPLVFFFQGAEMQRTIPYFIIFSINS